MRVVLPYGSLTPDQRAAVDAQFGNTTVVVHGTPPEAPKLTPYTGTGARKQSNLEKRYQKHLDMRVAAGEVLAYAFEGLRLRLDASTTYTPDFVVLERSGLVLVELKPEGSKTPGKPYWQPRARVKWKWAGRELAGAAKLVAVWPIKATGSWGVEVYGERSRQRRATSRVQKA